MTACLRHLYLQSHLIISRHYPICAFFTSPLFRRFIQRYNMKQHIKTHRIELLADGGKAARDMDYGSDAPEDDVREMGPLKNLPTFLEHPERGLNMTQ